MNTDKPNKKLIHLIAAARPNFMKIAPLWHALKKEDWATPFIVHTGQHYDLNMSDVFFQDLGLPEPDLHLGVGSGSHAEQTGQVMIAYEKVLMDKQPDLVVVVGDVNSTIAATLAAAKLGIKTAHLEAGLRSFDRTMPEEINRMVTDTLADILWTPSPDGDENLIREGVAPEKIHRVGNIMIDSLEMLRHKIENQKIDNTLGLKQNDYVLVTLHRPSNVDDPKILNELCQLLRRISQKIPIVFPVHPRTRKNLEQNNLMSLLNEAPGLHLLEPLNYIRFMNLVFHCRFVITDSGGIQEETSYLGIPCLTMRPNTERPITITQGTNQLCKLEELEKNAEVILAGKSGQKNKIELWDGQTAARVVSSIKSVVGR
ncbi:non-hydrolyzing UDP-N-acetylglucosamine 2-epimerase [Desulfonema magnum]|uniref:UDP-N-acetylglucosamine 2-epimerase n=1 Tax=Desulfonema magnum TaxID=45655 RepID=A0A975GKN1_9BACT|nr:UDP-N-acetylglucosamine 2-epimerase (non-hydrolyzing) [Desulfonema magnum]QTA84822.1 UDP-N-acetylglucosamine 2-epimerase [Desulfonema magnum]